MRFMAACLMLLCAAAVGAQESGAPPALLLEAAHCLATMPGDRLEIAARKAATVELGYVADAKSYPGQDLLTIVNYTIPAHARGTAFRLLASRKSSRRSISILYSVGFLQSDDGSHQISLVNPPLGGIGAQDEIVEAIRRIGFFTFSVPVSDLLQPSASVDCKAESLP